jgi:hypothetical protein
MSFKREKKTFSHYKHVHYALWTMKDAPTKRGLGKLNLVATCKRTFVLGINTILCFHVPPQVDDLLKCVEPLSIKLNA